MNTWYKHGDWNAICDVCGFKFKASQLKKRWDGLYVCDQDWEPRHEQDLIRYPTEDTGVPWSRPEGQDVEISVSYVSSSIGNQETIIPGGTWALCIADIAVADISVCDEDGNI